MSKKATEKLEVDRIEVLADKGYFDIDELKNSEKYKQRQSIVEHPFGTIKRTKGCLA